MPASEKLPVRTKLGFGVADLGGNLFFTAMGFWSMNYLTDTVGIPAALAGMAVMVAKIWDAVTDPMMGYISDRTISRMGRRRPYMIFGAVPLLLASWLFFTAPNLQGNAALTAWAIATLCLLNTAYTVVNIPYGSLTPELTKDYHERTSLNGYRFGFAVIGTILGAAVVLPMVAAFGSRRAGFSAVGLTFGLVMAVTALITGLSVKERPHDGDRPKGFFKTYAVVFKNKPYLVLLFTYMLNLAAINFLSGILVYYFKYVYNNEGLTTMAMVLLLVIAMVFIPISVFVSKRIGKKRTYQICFTLMSIACMAIFFFGHTLGPAFTLAMMALAGVGLGFEYVPPFAMLPDAIEVEAQRTGQRREGAYYGIWTFVAKLGQSVATALMGFILALSHYVPDAVQTPQTLFAIRLLVGPIPTVIMIAALVLIEFYPIDEKTYAAIMAGGHKE
ncbi:MAG: MFS transporter [Spirochaetales bacterium]|nr:MAG: MFS transporter [Spirochaetales bacterium]